MSNWCRGNGSPRRWGWRRRRTDPERRPRIGNVKPLTLSPPRKGGKGMTGTGRTWLKRSEEHTSELQSLMRNAYAVFCLKQQKTQQHDKDPRHHTHHGGKTLPPVHNITEESHRIAST